jgi:hypothetical protein
MANIFYSGTALYSGNPLTSKFQAYDAGNVTGYTPVTTNIKSNDSDINTILSPRDNKAGNAALISNGAITSNSKDLTLLFNKTGATYDVTVGGAVPVTGNVRNTGIKFPVQSPTANGVDAPIFTVPTPTVDTTGIIKTTCTGAGSYSNFAIVSSQSPPNTTYYTIASQTNTGTGSLVLRLPGNYQPGTISGSFNISTVTATTGQTYITPGGRQYSCSITNITFSPTVSPLPTYTYAWSQVAGYPVTFSSLTTSTVTVTGTGSATGATSGIQCKITYTGGGGATGSGEIIKSFTLVW